MDVRDLEKLVAQGEGMSLEFKRCGGDKIERDVFETVCSFANRQGGAILLGVTDDGDIPGVDASLAAQLERNLVNVASNPKLFNPSPTVEAERINVGDGRVVIRVWVPMGPETYRFKGEVFDRVADVDGRLTSDVQISGLAIRKRGLYSERRVYPWITKSDLRLDLLQRVRELVAMAHSGSHPWAGMDDDELLRASRLWSRDAETGERGFTLAAALLVGSDDLIFDVAPAYRTEALLRRIDVDRYDDRVTVQTNLIDAYDQLVAFGEKWLPDSFALDGVQRVSPRSVIVRELVSNTLMHREYSSPYMAKLEIGRGYLSTRNASRSAYAHPVTLDNLDPTPKNPVIASFFSQIGRSERLGSGTRKLYKYSRLYAGADPKLTDGDFFEAMVPVPDAMPMLPDKAGRAETPGRARRERELDEIVALVSRVGKASSSEISSELGIQARTLTRRLNELVEGGVIVRDGKGPMTRYRLPQ